MRRLGIIPALVVIALAGTAFAQDNPVIVLPDPAPANATAPAWAPEPEPAIGPLPAIGTLSRSAVASEAGEQTWKIGLHVLQRLPANRIAMGGSFPEPGILRLTGEIAEIPLGLTLPSGAPAPASVRLVLRSSVNDLPDRSDISVSINGVAAGSWPLDRIGDWGQIDIPGTALRGGDNVIVLSLRQHHRIFCGPEASFGVWTEIDLPRSGVSLPADAVSMDAASFGVVLANSVSGGQPIDIRLSDGVSTDTLAVVTSALRGLLPEGAQVAVSTPYDPLRTGGRQVGISLRSGSGGAAEISYRRDTRGALVMQITDGAGLADLVARLRIPASTPAGPPALEPGPAVTFDMLGVPSILRNTRYASADVSFTLPQDWMDLSSRKALLTLEYGYADDLPEGSILLIKANDETIILLPLDVEGGGVLPPLPVRFPAQLLHGGENRISFEMIVPGDPSDIECPARDSDMLVILGASSLSVPPTPSMTFGTSGDRMRAIGPQDVTSIASDPAFLRNFVAQLALKATDAATNPAQLVIARMPQDFASLPGDIGIGREGMTRLFQTAVVGNAESAPIPFRLSEADASRPLSAAEADWAGLVRRKVLPGTETLDQWLRNRSAKAVVVAPGEGSDKWTLIADASLSPGEIATRFADFRRGTSAQGAEVALWTGAGWEVWPPKPMPRLAGVITPRDLFLVLGNYASWAPGYYALILVALALLSALPAYLFVILTRGGRT